MLDDLNVRYVLQAERMGHKVPGMRGVYSHIVPEWRADLVDGLKRLWEQSLDARLQISGRSSVPLLDGLLAAPHPGKNAKMALRSLGGAYPTLLEPL
jgi:hypothetical protein